MVFTSVFIPQLFGMLGYKLSISNDHILNLGSTLTCLRSSINIMELLTLKECGNNNNNNNNKPSKM
jgi:hypothetical protein